MSEHNDKSEQEAGEEQDVKRWTPSGALLWSSSS
jgi:hypothetical protein